MSTLNVLSLGRNEYPSLSSSYTRKCMTRPIPFQRQAVQNTFFTATKAMAWVRGTALVSVLCLLALALGTLCPAARAQTGQWNWVGAKTAQATYGTEGVADPANIPAGRHTAASWTDASGRFWTFGGALNSNAMWMYDLSTGNWTWMGGGTTPITFTPSYGTLGVPDASNLPGYRYAPAYWTDSRGRFWLFGGNGRDGVITSGAIQLNDLWMFDPSTGYWTWMGGSRSGKAIGVYGTLGVPNTNNTPGARDHAAFWTDNSGNFWLFGGYGYDAANKQSVLNDLWRFDPEALQWTWMAGSSSAAQLGTFGTQGVAAGGNTPSAITAPVTWTDSSGNLWLFGGYGYAKVATAGDLNDLWKYSPSTGQWMWVWGDAVVGKTAVYGAVGVENSGNKPGARDSGAGWVDVAGDLWLYGGYGYITAKGLLGDLWRFNPSTGNWTWMGGDSTTNKAAVYNAQGAANSTNDLGEREDESVWLDLSGNVWFFGGATTYVAPYNTTTVGGLNDLWEYQFSAAADQPVFNPAGGTYPSDQTVTISDSTPGAVIYYTTDGTTPTIRSTQYTAPITVNTQQTLQAIAIASGYSASPVATAAYAFDRPPAATPVFSPASGAYPGAQVMATITDATSSPTIYYTTDGSTPTTGSPVYNGPIIVTMPATIKAVATGFEHTTSGVAAASYTQAVVATPLFSLTSGAYSGEQIISITDATPGATIYYTTDGSTPTTGSPVYTSAIAISSSGTIKAMAVASGYINSTVSGASYIINYPTAVIGGITPVLLTSTTATTTLTITCSNFVPASVLYIGLPSGTALPTQYVSPTELTAQFPGSYLSSLRPGTPFYVTVAAIGTSNPSNQYWLAYVSASSSMPINITPSSATVAAGGTATYYMSAPTVTTTSTTATGAPLSLGADNLPAGVTFQWTPTENIPNTGTITISTTSATPPGTYTILIAGNGSVEVASSGMLLPILFLPLLSLRKRLAAKRVWLTLSMGLILLGSALSFVGCAATGPKYSYGSIVETQSGQNATTITLTVQ